MEHTGVEFTEPMPIYLIYVIWFLWEFWSAMVVLNPWKNIYVINEIE